MRYSYLLLGCSYIIMGKKAYQKIEILMKLKSWKRNLLKDIFENRNIAKNKKEKKK
jgi:hypothetical protein